MLHLARPRRWRSLVVTALVALTTAGVITAGPLADAAPSVAAAQAAPAQGPSGDAFYRPPNPLPAGRPGDVIRWRQSSPTAYQIMYLSTNARGQRNAVTGTIVLPPNVTDLSRVPIVGYAVGTQGVAFRCVASKNLTYEQPQINQLLDRGWALAITDYEGYNPNPPSETNTPTFVVGRSEGPAVLDSVRAATRLPAARLNTGSHPVALQGYSQGGGAALWAAELQPSYAPELDLRGVAAGGVPADLNAVAQQLNGNVGAGLLFFAASGLNAAYPDLNLNSYLNDAGRTALADSRRNDCIGELLVKYSGKRISDFTTSNPLDTVPWRLRLLENQLGNRPPRVPVFQWQAGNDQLIPALQAQGLAQTYCRAGVRASFRIYPFTEHATGYLAGATDATNYVADRFAGRPAPTTC